MRRIGSALAAGVATAGLFGAFAWLNVAPGPRPEQRRLESFALVAVAPDRTEPVVPKPAAAPARPVAPAAVPAPPAAPAVPVPVVPVPGPVAPPPGLSIAPAAVATVAGAGAAGTAASSPVASPPTPMAQGGGASSYAARVRAWLLAHKRYPRRSRLHREEGVVRLRFVLDRAGHLLDGALVAPSDHVALDAEALAMLRRAVPYPLPPGDLRGDRIEIAAAIAFELPR